MISRYSYTNFEVIRRLCIIHIRPYIKIIVAALLATAVTAMMSVAIIEISKFTVDRIFVSKSNPILLTAPAATVVFIIKGISQYYQNYLSRIVSQNILRDIQLKLYKHLIYSDIEFLQKLPLGKLMSSFTNDIVLVCNAISSCLVIVARHLLTVIFLTICMFTLDWFLAVLAIIVFIIASYSVYRLGQQIQKIAYIHQEKFSNHIANLDDTFRHIKLVRLSLAENLEIIKAENRTAHILQLYAEIAQTNAISSPLIELLNGCAVGIIILYGGSLAAQGLITPGTLTGFLTAFATAYRPLVSLLSVNSTIQEGMSAAKRILNILDTSPVIERYFLPKSNDLAINLPISRIEFRNVSLSLNNRPVLHNTSFLINAGETVILFGKSGSGKTTIANLMVRFYHYSSGSIMLNDVELKDISLHSLRQYIVLVPQEDALFNTTIADNIAYSRSEATLDDIISAAKKSLAHEFITNLPNGYNTAVGYRGCELSTGQKQRIAIARALLQNPEILILDESTSALDQSTELAIYQSIKQCRQGKITLIITHAVNAVANADKAITINDGMVSSVKHLSKSADVNIYDSLKQIF